MTEKFKILAKYIKDISSETADIETYIYVKENISKYEELITHVEDRPGHDSRYAIDASKIANKLNWSPAETFNTGIKKTVEWYLENINWCNQIVKNNNQSKSW